MSYADLESMKLHLDTMRQRILALQNAQSALFRLPGELRNHILRLAMHAELLERKNHSRTAALFKEPAFFSTSRQIRNECMGVWFSDVLSWEELIDYSGTIPKVKTDIEMTENAGVSSEPIGEPIFVDCSGTMKYWRRLDMEDVKSMCSQKSKAGKFALVTQASHCDLFRTKASVESSRSICPRKGLVRVRGWANGCPSLRWWVW